MAMKTGTVVPSTEIESGKPYVWKSGIYGDVAVHVVGFSPNGKVAKLSIDGGADSSPARNHLALKNGFGYCVLEREELHRRPRRGSGSRKTVEAETPKSTQEVTEF